MGLESIKNFDYTVLLCSRMNETREFYRDVMRFPVEIDLEHWVSFRVGASLLTLRPRTSWPFHEIPDATASTPAVQLAFRVPPSEIDACYDALRKSGVTILRHPTDLPAWRHRTLFFLDPEGNVIEIYAEI
jgi:catechol 2,3-dioxygenase-like lactoylglutathione lyase family enzyme